MSNLELWDRFADIDPAFTKAITGKAYRGTSPNPQYVIRCMTEMFGPVGRGFGWEVMEEAFTPLGDEVLHWCRIRFWHGNRDTFFESYGQTKALMKTKNGLMSDEDAPKKSLTDAIVKAASHIGIAANIFLGRWDDQKYVQSVANDFREQANPDPIEAPAKSSASLKRADADGKDAWTRLMDDLRADLTDCGSVITLIRLKDHYRERAREERWPRAWLEALANEFANAEEQYAKPEPNGDAYRNAKDGKPAPVNVLAAG